MSRRAASIAAAVSLALLPAIAAAQPAPADPVIPVAPPVPQGLTPIFPPGVGTPGTAAPAYPPRPLDFDGMQLLLPPTLAFEEGQTVPSGYVVGSRTDRSLVVAGSTAFGVSYLTSLIAAGVAISTNSGSGTSYAPLFVPVIGPYITIGTAKASGAAAVWLALDGLAQTGGATVFVYSLIAKEKYLNRKERDRAAALDVLLHPVLLMGPRLGMARWTF
jgi:hypothetical protein